MHTGSGTRRYDRRVPDPSVSPVPVPPVPVPPASVPPASVGPTLDLRLSWRGAYGRLRVFPDRLEAETDYERAARADVPMDAVRSWHIGPCDEDAVCIEFVTGAETFRVLLDTSDEELAALAIRKVLGPPQPAEPSESSEPAESSGS